MGTSQPPCTQPDWCRTCRHSPMMFLMSSSSRACFGVAGMVGLTGVAGVLACPQSPGLLSEAGLVPTSLKVPAVVATAGLGTGLVAAGRLSVAVATTVLAEAAGSCGVPSSASPTGAVVVSGVSQLTAVGSSVGPVDVAGDSGTVAVAAVSAVGGVVGSLPGVGGHPTGEGFLTPSPARLLGLKSWSSISRSTVLSPLNSSSAAKHRHRHQPHSQREQVPYSPSPPAPPAPLATSPGFLVLNPCDFPLNFQPEKGCMISGGRWCDVRRSARPRHIRIHHLRPSGAGGDGQQFNPASSQRWGRMETAAAPSQIPPPNPGC